MGQDICFFRRRRQAAALGLAATSLASGALAAGAASASAATPDPERVTFRSGGTELVGYHYAPDASPAAAPLIVIAHGLGGLQTSRLPPVAARFAAAGYHALTFDYRTWGQSQGTPRNIIDAGGQQADYRAAVAFGRSLPGVDADRIVLWGTSLSGGHVLALGAQMPQLAAVIAQAPHVSGPATTAALPLGSLPALTAAGVDDAARAVLRRAPRYVPLSAAPGGFGALSQPGAAAGYAFVQPVSPPPGNVMAARFVLQLPFYNPDLTAFRSRVPTLIGVGDRDNVTPPAPAIALARKMGATLKRYPGGHFSVYPGADQYEAVSRDQLDFLRATVPVATTAASPVAPSSEAPGR